jgi:hypothetical protein
MELLKRLFGGKEKQTEEVYEITVPKGVLRLWLEQDLQQDPDPKVEEYWIESLGCLRGCPLAFGRKKVWAISVL